MTEINAWNTGPRGVDSILKSFNRLSHQHPAKITALFEASKPGVMKGLREDHPHKHVVCKRSDVILLFPKGKPQPKIEVIEHNLPWVGPHNGIKKEGRRFLLMTYEEREAFLFVHRISGGPRGPNAKSFAAESDLIERVMNRKNLPKKRGVIGDHNCDQEEQTRIYRPMGLQMLPVVAKVDAAAVQGLRGRGTRLGNYGSDHVAIGWDFW